MVLSCLFMFPIFLQYDIETGKSGLEYKLNRFFNNEAFTYYYKVIAFNIFIYAIPVAILIFLNANIIWRLRAVKKTNAMQSSSSSREGLAKAFLVVVLMYMVCQIPAPMCRFLHVILPKKLNECRGYDI